MFITKKVIQGLLRCGAPKGDPRKILHGALFGRAEDGKPYAVATSGKIGVKYEWDDPFPAEDMPEPLGALDQTRVAGGEHVIGADGLKTLKKNIGRGGQNMSILNGAVIDESHKNGSINTATTDLETTNQTSLTLVDGKYPNIDVCIPKPETRGENPTHIRIAWSAKLMAELMLAMVESDCVGSKHGEVIVNVPLEGNSPILVQGEDWSPGGVTATAIIMPVRITETDE